jgi:hypothetical protein
MILIDKLKRNHGEDPREFERKVRSICELLNINPNWLMMTMWFESGLNAQAVNKQPGDPEDPYTRAAIRGMGLIGFMQGTAKWLGTTTQALYKMSAIEQLDWVYKCYKGRTGNIKCFYDLYLFNFFPIAVGKPDDWVIQSSRTSAEIIAKQNSGLDLNKDRKVTVGEVKERVRRAIPPEYITDVLGPEPEKKKEPN